MNLAKSYNVFNPDKHDYIYNIIGCGAVGSVVAEMLARLGVKRMRLYDFDVVESKNVANQMFFARDIDSPKVEALKRIILEINPECDVRLYAEGYTNQQLKDVVIMAVDNIKVRQQIMDNNKYNPSIKCYMDFRMGLYSGQHFFANGMNEKDKKRLRCSMEFEDNEVQEVRSACHETLSFCPAIRSVVAFGVANMVRFLTEEEYNHLIMVNPYVGSVLAE